MKTYLRNFWMCFALCFCSEVGANTLITGFVTVTNIPTDGATVTVNATTRTWKDQPVPSPSVQIAITNSIGGNATNLFTYLAVYPIANVQIASFSNYVSFLAKENASITITVSTNWATVTYLTNTVGDLTAIRVPFAHIPDTANTNRVYQATELVRGINDYSSLAFDQNATAASELVGKTNSQTITGVKIITGNWIFSGNVTFTNNPLISIGGAIVRFETNSSVSMLEGSSLSFGTNAILAFVQPSLIQGVKAGVGTTNWNFNYTPDQDTIMRLKDGTNLFNALFSGTNNNFTNLQASGGLLTGMTISNATAYNFNFAGSNSFAGTFALKRTDFTSLANGNNSALDFSDAIYAKIAGGPTAAFSINGILPGTYDAGHSRWLIIENATGQDMTIADNSGSESTPANRIRTLTGTDVTTVGDEIIMLFYDSSIQRWKLMRGGGGTGGSAVSYGSQFDFTDLVHLNLADGLITSNQVLEGNVRTTARDVGETNGTINVDASLSSEFTARVATGGLTIGFTNWQSGHNLRLTVTNLGNNSLTITNVITWWESQTTTQPAIDQGNGYVNLYDLRRNGSSFTGGRIGLSSDVPHLLATSGYYPKSNGSNLVNGDLYSNGDGVVQAKGFLTSWMLCLGDLNSGLTLTTDNVGSGVDTSILNITSDNATAANRTFSLFNSTQNGQLLLLRFVGANTCQLVNSGNLALADDWTPTDGGQLLLIWDGNVSLWREISRFPSIGSGTSSGGTNLTANVLNLAQHNLGTISGGGTATIDINTNLYRAAFSGSTFSINLPTPTTSTNGYYAEIIWTNSSGGTQIGTIKVATVTSSLVRESLSPTATLVSTVTNSSGGAGTYTFRAANGAWVRVDSEGDTISGVGLAATDIDTAAELLAITTDLFDAPSIGSFVNSGHDHHDGPTGGRLPETSIDFVDPDWGLASTNSKGYMRILSGDATKVINGQGNEISLPGGGLTISPITVSFRGNGAVLTTNIIEPIFIPRDGTISGVTILGDTIGSCVIDLYRSNYTGFAGFTMTGSSITASATPTINTTNKYRDENLTGWTTNLSALDIIYARVTSNTGFTNLTLTLTEQSSGGLIGVKFGGLGIVPATNTLAFVYVPFTCTITEATILADRTGSAVIDVGVVPYASFTGAFSSSITASAIPTLGSAVKSRDAALTGWTPTVPAGSVVIFRLNSAATLNGVQLYLTTSK